MGESTLILWTDHTFNPWIGCTKVSAGCANCYAEKQDHRWGHDRWGVGKQRERTSEKNWKEPLRWDREAAKLGKRARVFCASLADVFDPEVPDRWRTELLDLIRRTPNLDWQLLTKRPQLARSLLARAVGCSIRSDEDAFDDTIEWVCQWLTGKAPANVWLGTTVEDQNAAEERIPELLALPARIRFLSCEPLLGAVDLGQIKMANPALLDGEGAPYLDALRGATWWPDGEHSANVNGIDWVIIGGESGGGARPFNLTWARALRDQCKVEAIPAFVKQLGAKPYVHDHRGAVSEEFSVPGGKGRLAVATFDYEESVHLADRKGGNWDEWPEDLRVRQFPHARPA